MSSRSCRESKSVPGTIESVHFEVIYLYETYKTLDIIRLISEILVIQPIPTSIGSMGPVVPDTPRFEEEEDWPY